MYLMTADSHLANYQGNRPLYTTVILSSESRQRVLEACQPYGPFDRVFANQLKLHSYPHPHFYTFVGRKVRLQACRLRRGPRGTSVAVQLSPKMADANVSPDIMVSPTPAPPLELPLDFPLQGTVVIICEVNAITPYHPSSLPEPSGERPAGHARTGRPPDQASTITAPSPISPDSRAVQEKISTNPATVRADTSNNVTPMSENSSTLTENRSDAGDPDVMVIRIQGRKSCGVVDDDTHDESAVPEGAALQVGPRGGMFYYKGDRKIYVKTDSH